MNQANAIPMRPLGDTGASVSAIGVGGFHLGKPSLSEADSIRIITAAIESGITFLDNSWDYNNGESEIRMGKALRGPYRERVFLMTKIDGRTREAAAQQIEQSLHRLQSEYVDLLQFHEIIRMEDIDRIFAPGGALEAVSAARDDGKVRYIGFTGHKSPAIHLKMLSTAADHQLRFDAVQMPLNVMDAHYDSFEKRVLPVLVRDRIGVLGMKPMGDPFILDSGTVIATECLHYALSLPTSVVITGIDSMQVLEQAINAARTFKPMTPQERAGLLDRTAEAAQDGRFEQYKTMQTFDSTAHNPQWLG